MFIEKSSASAPDLGLFGAIIAALIAVLCIAGGLSLTRRAWIARQRQDDITMADLRGMVGFAAAAIVFLAGGLVFGGLALDWLVESASVSWVMAYVVVFLLGSTVGGAELISRYKDRPMRAVTTLPAIFYILLNASGSMAALYFISIYPEKVGFSPNSGNWPAGILVPAVLIAGISSLLFFRTSIFKLRIGDADLAVGPSIILDSLLASADRAVDRVMAAPRATFVHEVMGRVSFYKAAVILPAHCLALMQNVSNPETQRIIGVVDSLRANKDMPDRIKSLNLGLALLTVVGEGVLRTAINGLRQDLQDSTAQFLEDVKTVMNPVSFERAAKMLPGYCFAVWPEHVAEEEQEKLFAKVTALKQLPEVPEDYKALLLGIWLAHITDGTTLRKAVGDLGEAIVRMPAPATSPPQSAPAGSLPSPASPAAPEPAPENS
jgi:hypothetical protein